MTSQGSPYARFQRALRIGRLSLVRAAAAELPRIDLADALSICLLMEQQDEERFERAAVRWLARLSLEAPTVGIEDLRQGLVAFEALADNPLGARALYLGSSLYRIHGSNEPETIGAAVSSGCIRMTNKDIVDLYDRARIGTKVVVRN